MWPRRFNRRPRGASFLKEFIACNNGIVKLNHERCAFMPMNGNFGRLRPGAYPQSYIPSARDSDPINIASAYATESNPIGSPLYNQDKVADIINYDAKQFHGFSKK